jgi:signal transduction histidine kinase
MENLMKTKKRSTGHLIKKLLLIIIIIFTIGQSFAMYLNYQDEKLKLENNIHQISNSLRGPLSEALWEYDSKQIDSVGEAFMMDAEIIQIIVTDNNTGVVLDIRKENKNIQLFQLNEVINYNQKSIGSLTIYYTNKYFLTELRSNLFVEIMILLIIIFAIIYMIHISSKKISDPIKQLTEQVNLISGDLDAIITIETESLEVDFLMKAFTKMQQKLQGYTSDLKQANESLENRVNERTLELNQKNYELEQTIDLLKDAESELIRVSKLELTQQLVSGVAHEINTPLGNAMMLSSYISHHVKSMIKSDNQQVEQSRQFEKIANASSRLDLSLKDVSDLVSQFKSLDVRNNISIEKKILLKELITSTLLLMPVDQKYNIILEIIGQDFLTIHTKPFVLTEVIKQLLENSCSHAYDEKQEIRVTIKYEQHPDNTTIYFRDYGKGINTHILTNIFAPFIKDIKSSDGSGIGLSIVENLIVNGLNGTIECSSEIGQGTVFKIVLYDRNN